MMKKLKGTILCLLALMCWMPASAQSVSFEVDGIWYSADDRYASEATASSNSGHLYGAVTIPETVTNTYRVFNKETLEWVVEEVISYRVTGISNAFQNCPNVTSISLPASICEIKAGAFYNCSRLRTVNLPGGITEIGGNMFDGCSSLESISIPGGVRSIGMSAFFGCSSLTSVVIPDGVTEIKDLTFSGCTSLTSVTIPSSVKYIGNDAFSDCGFTEFVVPEGVDSIGSRCFYECRNLKTVTLPKSLKAIGEHAFTDLPELTSIVSHIEEPFGFGITPIVYASYGGSFGKKNINIYIPANTMNKYKMAKGWSYHNNNDNRQTTLVEPNSADYTDANGVVYTYSPDATMAYVKDGQFNLNTRRYSPSSPEASGDIVIPTTLIIGGKSYTVAGIGRFALSGPDYEYDGKVRMVTLPASVEFVDYGAFCGKIEALICERQTPPEVFNYWGLSCVLYGHPEKTALRVPRGSAESYRQAPGWSKFNQMSEAGSDPLSDSLPASEDLKLNLPKLEQTNLTDVVIDGVYYNLGVNGSTYSFLMICKATDMSKIGDATPGSDDIYWNYTGLIVKVGKGSGTITLTAKTGGGLQLVTKIGSQVPEAVTMTEKGDVVVNYDVAEDTYVYIYAVADGSNARQTRAGQQPPEGVYIYGLSVAPEATGVQDISAERTDSGKYFNLQGQEVARPGRGIFIRNGRKVVMN